MPAYNPAPDQPLNVFFDLDIGGVNNIFDHPNIPMEFHFVDDASGNFDITVLDETGFMVEPYLWQGRDPDTAAVQATCKFGYLGANPRISPTWAFEVTHYTPTFLENAFAINLLGLSLISPVISTNQYSGTIMECLQDYCKVHDLSLIVNPPFGVSFMQDGGYIDRDTTATSERIHTKWVTEGDWAFVLSLLEHARDQQGQCGYRPIQSVKDGKKTLTITNVVNTSTDLVYECQAKDSVVVAWQPALSFTPFPMNGNDAQLNGYQAGTGDEYKAVIQPETTKQFNPTTFGLPVQPLLNALPSKPPADKFLYYNSELMPDNITGSAMKCRPGTANSVNFNSWLSSGVESQMDGIQATLVILGDPLIRPITDSGEFQTVQVKCYYPHNYRTGNITAPTATGQQLHYSSGTYAIHEVEHVVKAGSYLTVLRLKRSALELPSP